MKRILFATANSLALVILLVGCGAVPQSDEVLETPIPALNITDDIVSASAETVAGKYANLSFVLGGPHVEVYVKIGDYVQQGQILASFSEGSLPQAVISAKADLILAQEALDNILIADTALAQAVIALRDAENEFEKADNWRRELNGRIEVEEVVFRQVGSIKIPEIRKYKIHPDEETIAKADEKLALARAKLEDVKREIERLNNPQTSPEYLAAQTRVDAIQAVIDQAKLIAPFDGTIVETYVGTGELISPGSPVLLLADLSTLQVKTTDLNEVDVARIQIGDVVDVSFDALPNTTITGKVSEISLKNAIGSGVYYDVFVTLDEIPDELRWGMSAFVEIQVSK